MYNSAQYYGTWSYTDIYYYYCSTTTYSSLTSCSRRYRPYSSYCNSDDHVGLWCPSTSKNFNNNIGLLKISISLSHVADHLKYVASINIIFNHVFMQHHSALMGLFGWREEHHLIKENWSTVTMEHGLLFVPIFMMKRLQ